MTTTPQQTEPSTTPSSTLRRLGWYEVPEAWPVVEGWIAQALAHSIVFAPADIHDYCLHRQMDLWLVEGDEPKACVVTRVDHGPQATILMVMIVGGRDMDDWIDLEAGLYDYAMSRGCVAIEAWGRRGWQRVLKPRGWEPMFTIYRKVLADA